MKKKWLFISVITLSIALLAGCGDDDNDKDVGMDTARPNGSPLGSTNEGFNDDTANHHNDTSLDNGTSGNRNNVNATNTTRNVTNRNTTTRNTTNGTNSGTTGMTNRNATRTRGTTTGTANSGTTGMSNGTTTNQVRNTTNAATGTGTNTNGTATGKNGVRPVVAANRTVTDITNAAKRGVILRGNQSQTNTTGMNGTQNTTNGTDQNDAQTMSNATAQNGAQAMNNGGATRNETQNVSNRFDDGDWQTNYHGMNSSDEKLARSVTKVAEKQQNVDDARAIVYGDRVFLSLRVNDNADEGKIERKVRNAVKKHTKGKNVDVITDMGSFDQMGKVLNPKLTR